MYSYLSHSTNICFIDKHEEEKMISSRLDIEAGKDKNSKLPQSRLTVATIKYTLNVSIIILRE